MIQCDTEPRNMSMKPARMKTSDHCFSLGLVSDAGSMHSPSIRGKPPDIASSAGITTPNVSWVTMTSGFSFLYNEKTL